MVAAVSDVGWDHAPDAVATVGLLESRPNSRNVVPGSVFFAIDLRHPSDDVVAAMEAEMREKLERIAADAGLEIALECVWDLPAVRFDADVHSLGAAGGGGGGVSEPRAGLGGWP